MRVAASVGSSKWWKPAPTPATSKPVNSGASRLGEVVTESRLPMWAKRFSGGMFCETTPDWGR